MVKKYIPKQGDIVTFDFNPTKWHERKGFRPAIVVSHDIFNTHTKMAMVLPITSNTKEYPTHYLLEDTKKVSGSVLCEHIRSVDFESRHVKYVEKASDNDLLSIMTLLNACMEE